jgi:hypothetical protein
MTVSHSPSLNLGAAGIARRTTTELVVIPSDPAFSR